MIPKGAELVSYRFDKLAEPLELYMLPGRGFTSNPVTVRFTRAIELEDIVGKVVFDIGAGPGSLGIWAKKLGAAHVSMVEPSGINNELARENISYHQLTGVEHHSGKWYGPLGDQKADTIIGDASGIADGAARALWYSDEVPTGGYDGTEILIPLIENASSHLNTGGVLYFPVTEDLADGARILATAHNNFKVVRPIFENGLTFPMSTEEQQKVASAYAGNIPPFIHIHESPKPRPGREFFWTGQIYRASDPTIILNTEAT